ncbi:MAG TPA: peroxide stress protein YaaA [Candidatus Nanopelagicales bacterium]
MTDVLVLLPPSEAKTEPATGPRLDLAAMSLPALRPARRRTLTALVRLARGDLETARTTLKLSPGQVDEVRRDATLRAAPTAPAAEVYSGVLFGALDAASLPPAARARLDAWVLVWSGLWGAVRLSDPIPAYRLSGAVSLPGLGPLAAHWRPALARALRPLADVEGQVVLDLRSGTYTGSWTPSGPRGLTVRVVQEQAGTRTVASHANKAAKGRLVRSLALALADQPDPCTPDELLDVLRAAGHRLEPGPRGTTAGPRVVDVVVEAL